MADIVYYELKQTTMPYERPGEFVIMTAAVMDCGLCGRTISGMGGPGDGAVCMPCGNELRRGALRGAVKWDAPHD